MLITALASVLVFAGLIALWQAITNASLISPIFLPGPDKAWGSIVAGFTSGTLSRQLGETVVRMLAGWAIASVIGIALGCLIGMSSTAKAYLGPTVELMRPVPASAVVPVCIAFLGLDDTMALTVIVFGSLWPVLLATVNGFNSVQPRLYEVAQTLCMRRWDIATKIALPSAMPEILAGLRVGVTLALVLAVLGEMMASRDGLGQWIVFAGRSFRAADLFAGVILLGLLGIITASVVAGLEAVLLRWRRTGTREVSMTRWLLGIFSALVLALNVAAPPASADPTKITLGHGFTSDVVSVYVAKNEGFFAKHNLDVTLTPIGNPQNLITGAFSGSLQIIMSNTVQFLTAVNGGLDFVVIAGGNRLNKSNDPIGLVLRSDVKYNSPNDLKGLTIAVPGFNSGMNMLFKQWLAMKHVAADQINFVEASMPNEGDMLKGRKVDGVLSADPFKQKMVDSGDGKLVAKFYTEVIPDQPATFWVSTRAWATANPQVVAEFRASLADASQWIPGHLDETKAIEQQAFGSSSGEEPLFNPTVTPRDLAAIYTIGKQLGTFTKPVDVNTLILR